MDEFNSHFYEFGEFRVDAAKRLLYGKDKKPIALTPKVFDTLLYLVRNHGKVIEKDELMSEIWTDTVVEENNLNKNVSTLRRALGEKKDDHRYIVTIPGRGYKLVAEVILTKGFSDQSESKITKQIFLDKQQSDLKDQKLKIRDESKNSQTIKNVAISVLIFLSLGAVGLFYFQPNKFFPEQNIKTIAVLPFKPISPNNRNETLELGMADTLINKLSTGDDLIVRPLGSIRRYGNLEQDSLLAGRELNVDSVLEGTLQTSGKRIRVSVRLFRTSDGKQLWTGQFDEKLTDIFAVQDSISEKVFAALTLKLSGEDKRRLVRHDTENIEAYQLYMKGRFHQSKLILPEARKALEYFQQATELDPNYALAFVGIADAYRSFALSGDIPANEVFPKAKEAARRAFELNPDLPESQVAVGLVNFWYERNWSEAEKHYKKALELDPDNSATQFAYAHLNSNLGRHEKATMMGARARELDPLSLIVNSAEGQFLFFAGRSDEAILKLQKTLELDPDFWHAHLVLSMIYTEKKMFPEAVSAAEKAAKLSNNNSQALATKGYALAKSGDLLKARYVLEELKKLSREHYVPAYNFAIIHNGLGEIQTAIDFLEKASAEKNVLIVFLKVDPKWNNIRCESRFVELMRQMNFN